MLKNYGGPSTSDVDMNSPEAEANAEGMRVSNGDWINYNYDN